MSKWYDVKVVNYQSVMVEVPDDGTEEMAMDLAMDFAPFGGDTEYEVDSVKNDPTYLDSCIRHADEVVYLKDYQESDDE
jgi:hypothetical protein